MVIFHCHVSFRWVYARGFLARDSPVIHSHFDTPLFSPWKVSILTGKQTVFSWQKTLEG